jgi:hypothetical protein
MKQCNECTIFKNINEFHKDKSKTDGLDYYCKSCRKERKHQYYLLNKEKVKKRTRKWQIENPEKRAQNRREYQNRPENRLKVYEYRRKRWENDTLYQLAGCVRTRINKFLRGVKSKRTEEILGCTIEELKPYLESKFLPNMSWDNYGFYGWHIDHIIPLASAKTIEEIKKLCYYTNLQPLWRMDNIKKSDKI